MQVCNLTACAVFDDKLTRTGAGSFQQLITIGRITMVGELASFVGNAPLLAQVSMCS